MGRIRDLGLGVVVGLVGLVVAEGALRVAGVGAPRDERMSKGFDASANYLTPTDDGGVHPVFWEPEDGTVAPKGEAKRALLFGGSNVRNFGSRPFEKAIERATGEDWQVINLGANGYGSSRVRIIFDQALDVLEPDLVVVYSGHNEFVEKGFEMDLGDHWPSPMVRGAAERALETHLFNTALNAFAPEAPKKRAGTPEEWHWEYAKFADIDYAETLAYLEGYRANLTAMAARARAEGVPMVLSTIVYNRFAMPSSSALDAGTPEATVLAVKALEADLFAAVPEWLAPLVPREGWERVENFDWEQGWREAGYPQPVQHLTRDEMWGVVPSSGALATVDPLILAPEYWNSKVVRLVECLDQLERKAPSGADRAELGALKGVAGELLALMPEHPMALFVDGLCDYHLGAPAAEVFERLELAGDLDRAPRRGNRVINGIVRDVAASFEELCFVDPDLAFVEAEPEAGVGWKWMMDQCHLGGGGRHFTMQVVGTAAGEWLVETGRAPGGAAWR